MVEMENRNHNQKYLLRINDKKNFRTFFPNYVMNRCIYIGVGMHNEMY